MSKPKLCLAKGEVWGKPVYCSDGIRHLGGGSLIRALSRNMGTCRLDDAINPEGTKQAPKQVGSGLRQEKHKRLNSRMREY